MSSYMGRKLRYFLSFFVPSALLLLLGAWYLAKEENRMTMLQVKTAQHFRVELGAQELTRHLEGCHRDLLILSNNSSLKVYFRSGDPGDFRQLAGDLKTFSNASQLYDQIRWIDEAGHERVRVDLKGGTAHVIHEDKLQNKGSRYYFADTMALLQGQSYVSPLDLNVEGGAIEMPHKPMLRFAVQVRDDEGRRKGIVILNYLAEMMLDHFSKGSVGVVDHLMLLNRNGYWLKSENPADEWGFMFKKPLTLGQQYPAVWEQVRSADSGQFYDSSGLWTWRTVFPLKSSQVSSTGSYEANGGSTHGLNRTQYAWKVVSHVAPDDVLPAAYGYSVRVLLLVAVLAVIGWRLSVAIDAQVEAREMMEKLATTDSLTGLRNRSYFMQRLEQHWRAFKRRQDVPVGVVMIDIDFFKSVNDTYGHAGGDVALKHFAHLLQSVLRETDTACRYGGEEFVVVLPNSDLEGVRAFAERVRQKIERKPIVMEGASVTITVSIGGSVFMDVDTSEEQVLSRADIALYRAKDAGRNRVQLFTDDE